MAKKAKSKQVEPAATSSTAAVTPVVDEPQVDAPSSSSQAVAAAAPPVPDAKEVIKPINTSNLTELKLACDDCVKAYFGRPDAFTPSHVHEDIRLGLGWSATLIAFAAAYHGYRTSFEESKFWVTVGVVLYALLSTASTLYSQYVEKNEIFVGKRRTLKSRISTELLTISSTVPPSPTAARSPIAYISALFSPPTPSPAAKTPSPTASAPTPAEFPLYSLRISYVHSSSNGKALLHHAEATLERPFADWFDAEGNLWREGFEKELQGLLVGVMGE